MRSRLATYAIVWLAVLTPGLSHAQGLGSDLPPVTSPAQVATEANTNPYLPFIQAIQAAGERDRHTLRAWAETLQANRAVLQALQSSDAETVARFEKALSQMKSSSASTAIALPRVPERTVRPAESRNGPSGMLPF